jgi:hypothetical protein
MCRFVWPSWTGMSTSTWPSTGTTQTTSLNRPRTVAELLRIPEIGIKAVEEYGAQIYRILKEARGVRLAAGILISLAPES